LGSKDFVVDKILLPSVDLRKTYSNRTLENWLGLNDRLTFDDCWKFLNTKPKKDNFKKVVEMLLESRDQNTQSDSLETFNRHGVWLSESGELTQVAELIDLDSEKMRLIFGKRRDMIHYWKEIRNHRSKISGWLNIPTLIDEDFTTNPKNKSKDDDFYNILYDRFELIAFDSYHDDHWEERRDYYRSLLGSWNFYVCDSIEVTCNKYEFSAPAFKIFEEILENEKNLFYVNSWKYYKTYGDLIGKIKKYFDLKHSESALMDFFDDDDREDVIQRLINKGLEVPDDWRKEVELPNNENTHSRDDSSRKDLSNIVESSDRAKLDTGKAKSIAQGYDGISIDKQIEKNKATKNEAMIFLANEGWEIKEYKYSSMGDLENASYKGILYSIIIRSAENGLLHLDQYAWLRLSYGNYYLLVKTGVTTGDFKLFRSQEELLNEPDNQQNIIVKDNTKQPEVINQMIKGLENKDTVHLYFVMNKNGRSILNNLKDWDNENTNHKPAKGTKSDI
jgi:hypothetical protein